MMGGSEPLLAIDGLELAFAGPTLGLVEATGACGCETAGFAAILTAWGRAERPEFILACMTLPCAPCARTRCACGLLACATTAAFGLILLTPGCLTPAFAETFFTPACAAVLSPRTADDASFDDLRGMP